MVGEKGEMYNTNKVSKVLRFMRDKLKMDFAVIGGAAISLYTGLPAKDIDIIIFSRGIIDEYSESKLKSSNYSLTDGLFYTFKYDNVKVDLMSEEEAKYKGLDFKYSKYKGFLVAIPSSLINTIRDIDSRKKIKIERLIKILVLPKKIIRKIDSRRQLDFVEAWEKIHKAKISNEVWRKIIYSRG